MILIIWQIFTGFWNSISKMKLEVSKLDQSPIDIHGYYVNNAAKDLPASLHVEWDACDMVNVLILYLFNRCIYLSFDDDIICPGKIEFTVFQTRKCFKHI